MFASSIGPPANQVTLQELIKRYSLTDEQLEYSDTIRGEGPMVSNYVTAFFLL